MSAKVVPAAPEMGAAKSVPPTVPAAMATAVTSTTAAVTSTSTMAAAAALGDRGARQRHHEDKNRNSQHAP